MTSYGTLVLGADTAQTGYTYRKGPLATKFSERFACDIRRARMLIRKATVVSKEGYPAKIP